MTVINKRYIPVDKVSLVAHHEMAHTSVDRCTDFITQ